MPPADPLHHLLQPLVGVRWGLLALRRQAEAGRPVAAELGQLEDLVAQALHNLRCEFSRPRSSGDERATTACRGSPACDSAQAPKACTP